MDRRIFLTDAKNKHIATNYKSPFCIARVPNPLLITHDNKQVNFYDDLIKGKQVLINMMYATCEEACSTTALKLKKVYKALNNRMGKDLHMYSITLKPEKDGPAELKSFAESHGLLQPGRIFLTGDPFDIETIRYSLFKMVHLKFDLDRNTHAYMLRIINDTHNIWTMANPNASLYTVLQHISWADPPVNIKERINQNRTLQRKIDEEVISYGYRRIV